MSATPSAEMLVVQGMAWICLPKRSVHTRMASYPLESGSLLQIHPYGNPYSIWTSITSFALSLYVIATLCLLYPFRL